MTFIPSQKDLPSRVSFVDKIMPVFKTTFAGKRVDLLSSGQVIDTIVGDDLFSSPTTGTINDLGAADTDFHSKSSDGQYVTVDAVNIKLWDIPEDDDLDATELDSVGHNISGEQYQISGRLLGGVVSEVVQLRAWDEDSENLTVGLPLGAKSNVSSWKLLDEALVYLDSTGLGILKINISGTSITVGTDEVVIPDYVGSFEVLKVASGFVLVANNNIYHVSNDLQTINLTPLSETEIYLEPKIVRLTDSSIALAVRSTFIYDRVFLYKINIVAGVPSLNNRKVLVENVTTLNSLSKVDDETFLINCLVGSEQQNLIFKEFEGTFYRAYKFSSTAAKKQQFITDGRIFELSTTGELKSISDIVSYFEVVRHNVGFAKADSVSSVEVSLYASEVVGGFEDLLAGERIVDEEGYAWGYNLNSNDVVKIQINPDLRLKGWF
jgi:hypothetical protein